MGADDSGADQSEAEARERALRLLEAVHQFPCAYAVTVIAFNREVVTEQVKRAALSRGDNPGDADKGEGDAGHELRASREGKYLSHRFAVRVSHAGEVLELYARLKSVEGVVTIL